MIISKIVHLITQEIQICRRDRRLNYLLLIYFDIYDVSRYYLLLMKS